MPSGVQVTGKIVPLATAVPTFPVTEDVLGMGGLYAGVATLADRDAILASFRKEGMIVYVKSLKLYYQLSSDLTTWNFLTASPELATQTTWWLSNSGSDTNDGKTLGTALLTTEEVSRRLCPGGRLMNCVIPEVKIMLDDGYTGGNFSLYVTTDGSTLRETNGVSIYGHVNSTAPITLSAVVDTLKPTTRGELTTLSGTFVAGRRITSRSGASIGATCYSTGLHTSAQNTYVTQWCNPANGHVVPSIANGTTVTVDTLTSTFDLLDGIAYGSSYLYVQDCIITQGTKIVLSNDRNSDSPQFFGCEIAGGIWQSYAEFFQCRITGNTVFTQGRFRMFGMCIQAGALFDYLSYPDLRDANCVSGGTITLSNGAAGHCTNDLEVENGTTGLILFTLNIASLFDFNGYVWGLAGLYDTGMLIFSGSWVTVVNTATVSTIPATAPFNVTGHLITAASIPIGYPRANCGIGFHLDPAAVGVTT